MQMLYFIACKSGSKLHFINIELLPDASWTEGKGEVKEWTELAKDTEFKRLKLGLITLCGLGHSPRPKSSPIIYILVHLWACSLDK